MDRCKAKTGDDRRVQSCPRALSVLRRHLRLRERLEAAGKIDHGHVFFLETGDSFGNNCLIAADIAGTRVEAATVIGYSPDEHVARWMKISSTGEYHDHRGSWKAGAIQFEPLTYTVAGVASLYPLGH